MPTKKLGKSKAERVATSIDVVGEGKQTKKRPARQRPGEKKRGKRESSNAAALRELEAEAGEVEEEGATELQAGDTDDEILQGLSSDEELPVATDAPSKPVPRTDAGAIGSREQSGVVYLGRIPHGFYEDQMREYFTQFGTILRLRLSRNRQTGASKHYAFIEFASLEVAKVVCETMDSYLIDGRLLRCKLVDPSTLHKELWRGANQRFQTGRKRERAIALKNANAGLSNREALQSMLAKEKKQRERLRALGIDYDFPGYAASLPK